MIEKRHLWSRDEYLAVFNLYLKIPFGKMHHLNPDVIKVAHLIGRAPNSVAIRLGNFASCDPILKARGIKGMQGGISNVCLSGKSSLLIKKNSSLKRSVLWQGLNIQA